MKKLLISLALLGASGCAGAPANITRTSTASEVSACERLTTQSTTNQWGGIFMKGGKNRALNKAERQAEEEGATHSLVIDSGSNYFTGGRAVVEGYKCP